MDLATIIGLALGVFFFLFSVIIDKGVSGLGAFFNAPSILVTIGGSIASTLISYPMKKFVNGLRGISIAFKEVVVDETATIKRIINLSNIARKEGLLALEEAAENIEDEFLKKGILLIVDGTDPELVRSILETEIVFIETRHREVKSVWDKLGELGPAWGMIGTLIGLINMLGSLDDPSTIGPAMSVALITTLYGSMFANFICIPIASKLQVRSSEELLLKEVVIEGLLSIQAGENPRVIEEKLKVFLAPLIRANVSAEEEAGEQ